MSKEENNQPKIFKNICNCGGFAWRMNGRLEINPHMDYCPQKKEYEEWYRKMNTQEDCVLVEPITIGSTSFHVGVKLSTVLNRIERGFFYHECKKKI